MSLKDQVQSCLGPLVVAVSECQGDLSVEVSRENIKVALSKLKEDPGLSFDFLSDLFGVDNSELYKKTAAKPAKKAEAETAPEEPPKPQEFPPRFEVIYLLLSLKTNKRLQVKVRVPEENPVVDSVVSLFKAATWPEREAYDMYGIRFNGHPDLRRLLMWEGFPAYPLRKDYPLEGRGEERHLIYD